MRLASLAPQANVLGPVLRQGIYRHIPPSLADEQITDSSAGGGGGGAATAVSAPLNPT